MADLVSDVETDCEIQAESQTDRSPSRAVATSTRELKVVKESRSNNHPNCLLLRNVSEITAPIRKQKHSRQRGFETTIGKSTRCLGRRNQTVGWADDRSPTNSLESRNGGTRSSACPLHTSLFGLFECHPGEGEVVHSSDGDPE